MLPKMRDEASPLPGVRDEAFTLPGLQSKAFALSGAHVESSQRPWVPWEVLSVT